MTKRELQRENNQLRDALEQARFRVDELDEIIVDALGIEDGEDADEDEADDEEEERGE
jgi:division protein CdvB (Snf7/Vps24/ESCRT-III family)